MPLDFILKQGGQDAPPLLHFIINLSRRQVTLSLRVYSVLIEGLCEGVLNCNASYSIANKLASRLDCLK